MIRTPLSDDVWEKVEAILPGKEDDRGRTATGNRWFLEAVLWIGRTDSPWRDLPAEFGRWHTVYVRFSRWRAQRPLAVRYARDGRRDGSRTDPDRLDGRASTPAFGQRIKKSGPQALGRSRDGLCATLHRQWMRQAGRCG